MVAILSVLFAIGLVIVAVSQMVRFDRVSESRTPLWLDPGAGPRRHTGRMASPALYLLMSVLTLLVIAALA